MQKLRAAGAPQEKNAKNGRAAGAPQKKIAKKGPKGPFPTQNTKKIEIFENQGVFGKQPSVVWNVPITLGDQAQTASSDDYRGYGSVDGTDGNIRSPDQTITTNIEGSGSTRLKHFDSNC